MSAMASDRAWQLGDAIVRMADRVAWSDAEAMSAYVRYLVHKQPTDLAERDRCRRASKRQRAALRRLVTCLRDLEVTR